jgi:hypothetical protein
VAGIAARLARALHKCNIFDAAWLPFRGLAPVGGVAVLDRPALTTMTVVMGAIVIVALAAMTATVSAAVAALAVAAMWPATMARFGVM